jgi:hypothetical protein
MHKYYVIYYRLLAILEILILQQEKGCDSVDRNREEVTEATPEHTPCDDSEMELGYAGRI